MSVPGKAGAFVWIGCAAVLCGALLAVPAAADTPSPPRSDTELRGEAYGHLMRSLFAAKRGEFRKAAEEIQAAIKLQPESADLHVQAATMVYRLGRTADAENLARKALELSPGEPSALRFLADRAAERALSRSKPDAKSRGDALALYTQLMEQGPVEDEVLRNVASLHLHAGNRDGALSAAQQLVEQRPGDRSAVGMLVQLLLESGREREALEAILAFVARHPEDDVLVQFADELTRKLNAWELVDRLFSESTELGTEAVAAQRLWGEALLRLGHPERATRALEIAAAASPSDHVIRRELAGVYRGLGRLADAASLLREVSQEAPSERRTHLLLAETFADQGETEAALNSFITALRLFAAEADEETRPVRDAIRSRMAVLYLGNDQLDAARDMLAELESPDTAEAQELMARLAITTRDWTEARQAVRRLQALGEEGVATMLEGEIFARTGRWAKAEVKFSEAIALRGPGSRVRVAQIYLDVDRPEPGEALLRAMVAEAPDNADLRFQLGAFLFRCDRFEESEREMREAFRIDPQHAEALNFLGYGMADASDRLDEALELIQRALEIDPWNGAYLDSLGWVYFRMGRYGEAREPLERAAREYPNDATVLEHLGDLYNRLGEPELARAAWVRALDGNPEDRESLEEKIGEQDASPEARLSEAGADQSSLEQRRSDEDPPIRP